MSCNGSDDFPCEFSSKDWKRFPKSLSSRKISLAFRTTVGRDEHKVEGETNPQMLEFSGSCMRGKTLELVS